MKWLIISDLLEAKKIIIGYMVLISLFNLFFSKIYGLFLLALLTIKGLAVITMKNDFSNSKILYNIFPQKSRFYVAEKQFLSIILFLMGSMIWFITGFANFSINEILYFDLFAIVIFIYSELYIYYFLKNGALKTNSALRPYSIGLVVVSIIVSRSIDEELERVIIRTFAENLFTYVTLSMIFILTIIMIGYYMSVRVFEMETL